MLNLIENLTDELLKTTLYYYINNEDINIRYLNYIDLMNLKEISPRIKYILEEYYNSVFIDKLDKKEIALTVLKFTNKDFIIPEEFTDNRYKHPKKGTIKNYKKELFNLMLK